MDKTDQQLVTEHLDGDEKAFHGILKRYLKPIYAFIYRLTDNQDMSEDIAQDTFIKVWKNLDKYDTKYSFKTWLYTIAHNTTLDWLKKKKAIVFSSFEDSEGENYFTTSLADNTLLPDELFLQEENKKLLTESLDKLPLLYKEILTLHYQQELSFIEIAHIVNKPLETIRSQHRRGLILLRKILTDTNAPKN